MKRICQLSKRQRALLITALTACTLLAALALTRHARRDAPMQINFPTAATTGTLYPLGSSMAALWNRALPGVRVIAQASGGGIDNLNFLREGEAQVTMAVASVAHQSHNGQGVFTGHAHDELRVIAGLYYNPNQVVVLQSSGMETLADIAGKRFAPGAAGSTTVDETRAHLTAAGIAYPDGFRAEFVGFNEAIDLMRSGQLEGAWIMAGTPTAAVTEIMTTARARLLPISDDVLYALQAQYPWYARYVIPAGVYPGQDADVPTTAIRMLLLTRQDMDETMVYSLTKLFWESIGELSAAYAALRDCAPQDAVNGLAGIPLHPGAARYYRELSVLD